MSIRHQPSRWSNECRSSVPIRSARSRRSRLPDVAPNVPAAGDINLFGGNRARDLQLAGQNLGQASDTLFALYQREAQDANDTRVQDLNNQFLDGSRAVLKTDPTPTTTCRAPTPSRAPMRRPAS